MSLKRLITALVIVGLGAWSGASFAGTTGQFAVFANLAESLSLTFTQTAGTQASPLSLTKGVPFTGKLVEIDVSDAASANWTLTVTFDQLDEPVSTGLVPTQFALTTRNGPEPPSYGPSPIPFSAASALMQLDGWIKLDPAANTPDAFAGEFYKSNFQLVVSR